MLNMFTASGGRSDFSTPSYVHHKVKFHEDEARWPKSNRACRSSERSPRRPSCALASAFTAAHCAHGRLGVTLPANQSPALFILKSPSAVPSPSLTLPYIRPWATCLAGRRSFEPLGSYGSVAPAVLSVPTHSVLLYLRTPVMASS